MNKRLLTGAMSAALTLAALHSPATISEENGFTVTPAIGGIDFDSDRNLDEDIFGAIGLGYKFNNPWQFELVYANGEADGERSSDPDVDYETLHLDVLYHLKSQDFITPYLVAGAGHVEQEIDFGSSDRDTKESNINAGMGLKFALSEMFSIRTDLRAIHDFDDENLDVAATLGLQMLFGGSDDEPKRTPVADTVDGDADGDGVSDSQDRCAGTPAGVEVDSNGCARDDDGDGVPNHEDSCPDTEAGAKVDAKGCYVILKEAREIELKVNFASNSDVVTKDYYDEVSAVADFLREYPKTNVVIEGHTDSSGKADYNQSLSERRAKNVASVLTESFSVDASRVSAVGYGEAKPIADNNTKDGKAKNRRVIAVVTTVVEKRAEK